MTYHSCDTTCTSKFVIAEIKGWTSFLNVLMSTVPQHPPASCFRYFLRKYNIQRGWRICPDEGRRWYSNIMFQRLRVISAPHQHFCGNFNLWTSLLQQLAQIDYVLLHGLWKILSLSTASGLWFNADSMFQGLLGEHSADFDWLWEIMKNCLGRSQCRGQAKYKGHSAHGWFCATRWQPW